MASQAAEYSFRAGPETCMLLTFTTGSRVPFSGGSRQRSSALFGRIGFPVLSNSIWFRSKLESIGLGIGAGGLGGGAGCEPPPPDCASAGVMIKLMVTTQKKLRRALSQNAVRWNHVSVRCLDAALTIEVRACMAKPSPARIIVPFWPEAKFFGAQ